MSKNPFQGLVTDLRVNGEVYRYFSLPKLNDPRVAKLPQSIRVLLESAVRNCDEFAVTSDDVAKLLDWQKASQSTTEIPFKPARVILQDFTGVPAVVDLAAMRNAVARLGGDPKKINPQVPADLVVDHSVQVDAYRTGSTAGGEAVKENLRIEMERNRERFQFLKWGQKAFENFLIVPPGSGIVHQVNLEYLARGVFNNNGLLYPDSLVGTDSHTTMINGMGVTGWGVGGIEAEAVMLGEPMSMVLPQVLGYRLTGKLRPHVTATDLVLTVTQTLRKKGVVGKFVEFFGPGMAALSLADRATLANMAPEYGATMGYFPFDQRTLEYLLQTGRDKQQVAYIEAYLRAQGMFLDYSQQVDEPVFSDLLELDLATVEPCLAGPKRPEDRVSLSNMQKDFRACLTNKVGFKGYGLNPAALEKRVPFRYKGRDYSLGHGDVIISAITSCTNTSNPSVLLAAALLARNAVKAGLTTKEYIKTSLAPGSGVVTKYLERSGLQPYLDQLGFVVVGYGCTTCIGNSGEIPDEVAQAVDKGDLVVAAVLSGNRNFEGRVHPSTRANYLASPPLCVAYALTGTVDFDFETQPIGVGKSGEVFLRDIWPSSSEVEAVVQSCVLSSMFKEVYGAITEGTEEWNQLKVKESMLYDWSDNSTYIHHPPFFRDMGMEPAPVRDVTAAFCLLNLGDSITTDHISPAGNLSKNSPAAQYLKARGVEARDFNTYGARRGHDEIMARGTFANTRLKNKLCGGKEGPNTLHVPSGEIVPVWVAAERYMSSGSPLIILGGENYGSGSSRDWAAKGPYLQGVRAVICKSFERIHRSNLVGMGILPLQFLPNEDADTLGLTGKEQFSIDLTSAPLRVGGRLSVKVAGGKPFTVLSRIDTEVELQYFRHGGILQYVIRKILATKERAKI